MKNKLVALAKRYLAMGLALCLLLSVASPAIVIAGTLPQDDIDAINGNWVHWVPGDGGVCGAAADINLTGTENAEKVFNYFVSQGLAPFQAAGILGNMQAESGVQPERLQGTPSGVMTPAETLSGHQLSIGWGLVQWTPATKIINPTKAAGKDPNNIAVQLDFLWQQMSAGGNEQSAGDALKKATNVDEAADAFLIKYERPLDPSSTKQFREQAAEQMLKQYGNGAPSGVSSTSAGCATSSAGSAAGVYKNPFRDIHDLKQNRIDQGVDYDGSGPVYAIGNGTVNGVYYNFYGGLPYVAYTLSDGPAAGKTVYFAECITVPSGIQTGVKVDTNSVIANMNASLSSSCSAGIETGWANAASLPDTMAHAVYQEGHATAYGLNFSQLLQSLGAPPGFYQYPSDQGHELGSLTAGWPTW